MQEPFNESHKEAWEDLKNMKQKTAVDLSLSSVSEEPGMSSMLTC